MATSDTSFNIGGNGGKAARIRAANELKGGGDVSGITMTNKAEQDRARVQAEMDRKAAENKAAVDAKMADWTGGGDRSAYAPTVDSSGNVSSAGSAVAPTAAGEGSMLTAGNIAGTPGAGTSGINAFSEEFKTPDPGTTAADQAWQDVLAAQKEKFGQIDEDWGDIQKGLQQQQSTMARRAAEMGGGGIGGGFQAGQAQAALGAMGQEAQARLGQSKLKQDAMQEGVELQMANLDNLIRQAELEGNKEHQMALLEKQQDMQKLLTELELGQRTGEMEMAYGAQGGDGDEWWKFWK